MPRLYQNAITINKTTKMDDRNRSSSSFMLSSGPFFKLNTFPELDFL